MVQTSTTSHAPSRFYLTLYSAFMNGQTYVAPKVPTLYTALTTGQNATNMDIYGGNTNQYLLNKGIVTLQAPLYNHTDRV